MLCAPSAADGFSETHRVRDELHPRDVGEVGGRKQSARRQRALPTRHTLGREQSSSDMVAGAGWTTMSDDTLATGAIANRRCGDGRDPTGAAVDGDKPRHAVRAPAGGRRRPIRAGCRGDIR
jgi:hypothetical protein